MTLLRLARRLALPLVAMALALFARPASAQEQRIGAYAASGTGLMLGASGGQSLVFRSPIFVDLGARTWSTEEPQLVYGGSVRLEVEGRVGVGVVPKIEYQRTFGPIGVSIGGGLPVFLAPYTLFGLEGFATGRFLIGDVFDVFASLLIDAYFFGSDLPRGTAIAMVNGVLGVELLF